MSTALQYICNVCDDRINHNSHEIPKGWIEITIRRHWREIPTPIHICPKHSTIDVKSK